MRILCCLGKVTINIRHNYLFINRLKFVLKRQPNSFIDILNYLDKVQGDAN